MYNELDFWRWNRRKGQPPSSKLAPVARDRNSAPAQQKAEHSLPPTATASVLHAAAGPTSRSSAAVPLPEVRLSITCEGGYLLINCSPTVTNAVLEETLLTSSPWQWRPGHDRQQSPNRRLVCAPRRRRASFSGENPRRTEPIVQGSDRSAPETTLGAALPGLHQALAIHATGMDSTLILGHGLIWPAPARVLASLQDATCLARASGGRFACGPGNDHRLPSANPAGLDCARNERRTFARRGALRLDAALPPRIILQSNLDICSRLRYELTHAVVCNLRSCQASLLARMKRRRQLSYESP